MNRKAFYDYLRPRLFNGGIAGAAGGWHGDGCDVWEKFYARMGAVTSLPTIWRLPTMKRRGPCSLLRSAARAHTFDKYEPGNEARQDARQYNAGDGYLFRGEGDVQNTGRRNAAYSSRKLNAAFLLGVDFVKNPEKRGDPILSAHCLFLGNRQGGGPGPTSRNISIRSTRVTQEDLREFMRARAIVNGSDKAEKIGRNALVFEGAKGCGLLKTDGAGHMDGDTGGALGPS